MDYYSHYKFLLNYYDKNTSLIITQYIFAKCIDCNDSYHEEFYECKCNDLRCTQHTYFKTIIINSDIYCNACFPKYYISLQAVAHSRVFIKCICCNSRATYGYKDRLCYCDKHNIFKKLIELESYCFVFNCINIAIAGVRCMNHSEKKIITYDNTKISIPNDNGVVCSFCNKKFSNIMFCKCSLYCHYCFLINVWRENNVYVCNICCNRNFNNVFAVSPYSICHTKDCTGYVMFGKYGILLYCNIHAQDEHLDTPCLIHNCYKLVVYKKRCYDHISEKIRKKIDYIIKN